MLKTLDGSKLFFRYSLHFWASEGTMYFLAKYKSQQTLQGTTNFTSEKRSLSNINTRSCVNFHILPSLHNLKSYEAPRSRLRVAKIIICVNFDNHKLCPSSLRCVSLVRVLKHIVTEYIVLSKRIRNLDNKEFRKLTNLNV